MRKTIKPIKNNKKSLRNVLKLLRKIKILLKKTIKPQEMVKIPLKWENKVNLRQNEERERKNHEHNRGNLETYWK